MWVNKNALKLLLLGFFVCSQFQAQAQIIKRAQNFVDSLLFSDRKFFAAPFAGYSPETQFLFGVGGFTFFRTSNQEKDSLLRPSSLRLAASYTQLRQVSVWLPFEIFFNENKFLLQGQLGYFNYPYFFHGFGRNTQNSDLERYTAAFPRLRIELLRKWKSMYFGPRYWFQSVDMLYTESGRLLDQGNITGSDGGSNSGLGFVFLMDNRKNIFRPVNAHYFAFETLHNHQNFGSDFQYNSYVINYRRYQGFYKDKHILAFEHYTKLNFGNVPFNQAALLGGSHRMRGYQEGRFRDRHMILNQLEYRSPLLGKIGFAVFGSAGWVLSDLNSIAMNQVLPSFGGGLRYEVNQKEGLRFRIDAAQGINSRGFYITVGEAF